MLTFYKDLQLRPSFNYKSVFFLTIFNVNEALEVEESYHNLYGARGFMFDFQRVVASFALLNLPLAEHLGSPYPTEQHTRAGLQRLSHSSLCFSFYFIYDVIISLYPKLIVVV